MQKYISMVRRYEDFSFWDWDTVQVFKATTYSASKIGNYDFIVDFTNAFFEFEFWQL